MLKLEKRKSQQEMAGFIIIVLLVLVVGVIMLGIFLRQSSPVSTFDAELDNFITASLEQTSNCAVDTDYNFQTLKQDLEMCKNNERCLGNINPCLIINQTYSTMLNHLFPAGLLSGYKMNFYFQPVINETLGRINILKMKDGNQTNCGLLRGTQSISRISGGGYMFIELEACTAKTE